MKHTARSLFMTLFILTGLMGLFSGAPGDLFAQAADATASAGALLDAATGQAAEVVAETPAPALSWQQALIALAVPLIVAGLKAVVPKIPGGLLPFAAAVLGGLGEVINAWASGGSANLALGLALGLAGVGVREATKQVRASMVVPEAPALN